MSRLQTFGAETGGVEAEADTTTKVGTGTLTADTGTFRSGLRSWKCDSTGSNVNVGVQSTFSGATGRSYFLRCYFNFTGLPTATVTIMRLFTATGGVQARITAAGKAQLFDGTSQVGSDSAATIATGQWYRMELRFKVGTGAIDEGELRLDGVQVASSTTLNLSDTAPVTAQVGWVVTTPGASKVLFLDDVALNDDQGSNQNTWPGEGKVVLLSPISDNARAALWTGGAGGTTSLFDAVNNTPPTGLASASATNTSQIEHAGGAAGTTDAYDANMTTPSSAGLIATDVVTVAFVIDVDGEDIATGTKLLNFESLSNPVLASAGNVTVGADVGAVGTWPTTWTTHVGTMNYNLGALAIATSPVMRARRPETVARVASVCLMGIILEYINPLPPSLVTPRAGPS